ncbi:hypothetical protein NUW58_g9824 [Xylaria curta]|uniref:Uncharacterized protein n=1 Tax=Xylaria curta TaxID=42375 RepID=A0ACC1MT73_9PEZI|nr:hypothetical protein NUW58_g9824 [Xylaria curta]
MCVGISPYENGILPPLASAIAYSPSTCSGSTPSVQVLSQAISICASHIMYTRSKRPKSTITSDMLDSSVYVSKFAMMLRCSYACCVMGIAFVNSCPTIVSDDAKKVRCSSMFAEWMGDVISIHRRYDRKISIVSMGEDADEVMKDVFKSYKDSNTSVRYTRTVNPAFISRMNVTRIKGESPIDIAITDMEKRICLMMGIDPYMPTRVFFDWYEYPNDTICTIMKMDSIMDLARHLVDHEPAHLLSEFVNAIEPLYNKMSTIDYENIISHMGVIESDDKGSYTGEPASQHTNPSMMAHQPMSVNPFLQSSGGVVQQHISTTVDRSGLSLPIPS